MNLMSEPEILFLDKPTAWISSPVWLCKNVRWKYGKNLAPLSF
ncbi:MAG: hypothetical protein ACLRMZ_02280 [Blautia marasmi]